jgi:hypothetical protein
MTAGWAMRQAGCRWLAETTDESHFRRLMTRAQPFGET